MPSPRKQSHVVVIGAGPAGSAAAFTLATRGLRVTLVDKSEFPRDKLCGGLLTLRSRKVFERVFRTGWDPALQHVTRGVKFFYRDRLLNHTTGPHDISFTCRREFDAFLLELAIRRGAKLVAGSAVIAIEPERSLARLADGRTLEYDFLVGADGVNSVAARSLFGAPYDRRKIGFGLELEVALAAADARAPDPEIYFGLIPWGYGWVFPKRDSLTVGIGGWWRRNPGMLADFHSFLHRRFGCLPAGKIKGYHLPFGDFRAVPGRGNILLCGDAAGLVEPVTGEGIAFAMQSGLLAAEAIGQAVAAESPETALAFYQARCAPIARSFRWGGILRYLLFPMPSQRLVSWVLPRTATIPKRYLDLMADEISYPEFTLSLARRAFRAPLKLLSGVKRIGSRL